MNRGGGRRVLVRRALKIRARAPTLDDRQKESVHKHLIPSSSLVTPRPLNCQCGIHPEFISKDHKVYRKPMMNIFKSLSVGGPL